VTKKIIAYGAERLAYGAEMVFLLVL